jgi:ferredoxin-thioredoxin reductase catalytic subunit
MPEKKNIIRKFILQYNKVDMKEVVRCACGQYLQRRSIDVHENSRQHFRYIQRKLGYIL